MVKMHKLTKGGQTIFPATIYDAVVNPKTRKNLTSELSEIDARISGKKEYSVGKNIINPSNLTDGYYLWQDGSLKQLSSYCVTVYISIEGNTQYHISKTGVGGAYHVIFDDNLKVLTAIKDGTVTTPENAAYIRLSISKSQLGAAQMELGDVATSYEPFTDNYENEQKFVEFEKQITDNRKETDIQIVDLKKELNLKADLENVTSRNLFNKDADVIPLESRFTPTTVDTFDADSIIRNAWIGGNKISYTSMGSLSPKIYFEENDAITTNGQANNTYRIAYFDANNNLLGNKNNMSPSFTVYKTDYRGTEYIRVGYVTSLADKLQVEYGTASTDYESYYSYRVVPKSLFPKDTLFSYQDVILPDTLYISPRKDTHLYLKQCLILPFTDKSVVPSLNVFQTLADNRFAKLTGANSNVKLDLYIQGSNFAGKTFAVKQAKKAVKPVTINVLNVGDSITDLAYYQQLLQALLASDNININWIGLMHGDGISYEARSGGSCKNFAIDMGNAVWLSVSGVTTIPQVGYPGALYIDSGGGEWVPRGYLLTDNGGIYSGHIKFGKFSPDPNYGDGESTGAEEVTFPASQVGTLTKSDHDPRGESYKPNKPGDEKINYTSWGYLNYNPFWDNLTKELSFKKYIDRFAFDNPDLGLFVWGYNETGGNFMKIDSDGVTSAVGYLKSLVDKFISDYPGAKVIVCVESYGISLNDQSWGKKYSILNYARLVIDTFSDYANVIIIPIYAMMDEIYGYGEIIEQPPVPYYDYTDKKLSGADGVHPQLEYGMKEYAESISGAVDFLFAD